MMNQDPLEGVIREVMNIFLSRCFVIFCY